MRSSPQIFPLRLASLRRSHKVKDEKKKNNNDNERRTIGSDYCYFADQHEVGKRKSTVKLHKRISDWMQLNLPYGCPGCISNNLKAL